MVAALFDTIAPRYDLLNRLMSLGMDSGWRRRALDELGLAPGALVLDLACGTGDLARELARRHYRAVGADLSAAMLAAAGALGVPLVRADAAALPLPTGRFDGVVSGFSVRNFAALEAVLAEAARVLRPGGRLVLLEVDVPRSAPLRLAHGLWMAWVVPALGALLSDAAAYRYLPRSLAYLPAPEVLAARLESAGFTDVARRRLAGGLAQVVRATRAGPALLADPRP